MILRPVDAFHRKGVLQRVVDGDTLYLNLDLGFDVWKHQGVRLARVDTPEVRGAEGPCGRYVKQLISRLCIEGDEVSISSLEYTTDKYDRCVAEVWFSDWNLSTFLLKERLAWATNEKGEIIGDRDVSLLSGIPAHIRQQAVENDNDQ